MAAEMKQLIPKRASDHESPVDTKGIGDEHRRKGPATVHPKIQLWSMAVEVTEAELSTCRRITRRHRDPYYCVYVGNHVYKSPVGSTDNSKYKWKPLYCVMPKGINNLYFEILDKRCLILDDLLGSAYYKLPDDNVFSVRDKPEVLKLCYSRKSPKDTPGNIKITITFEPLPVVLLTLSYQCNDQEKQFKLTASAKIAEDTAGDSVDAGKKQWPCLKIVKGKDDFIGNRDTQTSNVACTVSVEPEKIEELTVVVSVLTRRGEGGQMEELPKARLSGNCSGDELRMWQDMVASLKKEKCVKWKL